MNSILKCKSGSEINHLNKMISDFPSTLKRIYFISASICESREYSFIGEESLHRSPVALPILIQLLSLC